MRELDHRIDPPPPAIGEQLLAIEVAAADIRHRLRELTDRLNRQLVAAGVEL